MFTIPQDTLEYMESAQCSLNFGRIRFQFNGKITIPIENWCQEIGKKIVNRIWSWQRHTYFALHTDPPSYNIFIGMFGTAKIPTFFFYSFFYPC